ncbi:uncharacterized protein LOC112056911 [Bicyclus anynana]|uniref:Uncharacterized protein LOC112056911 n=1 Tax=Bicyclus anynana TaxID=110368 RepID=A0A6J1P5Y7_BICAN|nr:uncharacterized protein LOC112056911 [Bicyclus anynana]
MSIKKVMKGIQGEQLPADGLLTRDLEALAPSQVTCTERLGKTLQLEQETYLLQHPEVKAMLEIFMSKMMQKNKRNGVFKEAAEYFTRPTEELNKEILERLNLLSEGSYTQGVTVPKDYEDDNLMGDLRKINDFYYKMESPKYSPTAGTPVDTESSTFLSVKTSDTTLATPEPIPTPEMTLSETFFTFISNTVDKAIYLRVDDEILNYDTAYIELCKAVEKAMEIPVIEIREDIASLLYNAYDMFEFNIKEKERIAAAAAWEKRMRKKLKKTLRRLDNFKGYATPPTPKSEISSHESYKIPPPRPCICHPQFHYNRYPKDRFGIYLPSENNFNDGNVTVTPDISEPSDDEQEKVAATC